MTTVAGVALTAMRDAQRKDGQRVAYLMAASTQIWHGAFVCVNASGLLVPFTDASGLVFVGVAYESKLSAASGSTYCQVEKSGSFLANVPTGESFTQASVGLQCYLNSDNQVTTTSGDDTNVVSAGYITEFISASQCRVRIDGAVK